MTVGFGERQRRFRAPGTTDLALRVHTDRMDGRRQTAHLYLKRELADPAAWWLIPWCSVNTIYPQRHERRDLDLTGLADAKWCPDCTQRVLP
ncbi:hypothetical protein ATK36_2990 [Amycolatopsis sulphurea]|uniref:Uncharacterized protein n=1 Tax=Amycolatopsis sulphurea TaxID=76022 RepID=A0A2A9F993_9PSEU|nr:hypothetical protein ATK36_2990 [Amycolatopsis sulphurea]